MAHRQGGHKTKNLVFPSNWTGKWLYRAIINTPKWQINSVLNSYKYNEWISFESTYLNGLKLPERSDPETNYIRSVLVGVKVSQASKDYENMMNKVPLEDKVELLKDELATPIVGDMIRTLTTFVAPMPMTEQGINPESVVNVEFPEVKIKEKGAKTPVIING
jgi:hypothetical protein